MAITHTRAIETLEVLNDGNNVVCEVEVKWVSSDDSEPERTTIQSSQRYILQTEDVSPDVDGFVNFEDLTAEIVEGWIVDKLAESTVEAGHTAWINSVLNPPAPRTINKTTPW